VDRKSDTSARLSASLLGRARRGDSRAFSRLIEPLRRELVAYCFRLTGNLAEADDLVQEAFVRAFRGLATFEGRSTLRAWLYKIAHNLSLNHVQRRPPAGQPLDEIREQDRTAEFGESEENVRLGFVALVQSLPPRQRAALVLRDVLGWSAEEAARILETTVPAVKNALARARQTLAAQNHAADLSDVEDYALAAPEARAIIADWTDAFEKGNTARMVALLTGETDEVLRENPRQSGYNKSTASEGKRREERTNAQRQRAQRKSTG